MGDTNLCGNSAAPALARGAGAGASPGEGQEGGEGSGNIHEYS